MNKNGRNDPIDRGKISRRRYVMYTGIVAVAVAGSGSILWELRKDRRNYIAMTTPLEAVHSTQTPSSTTSRNRASTSIEHDKSLLSIVRGNSDSEIDTMVRMSVDSIGGMGKIVSPGETVVVKPPVITSNKDCAPDPRVVAAVVKMVKEAGGIAIVAESSGSGSAAFNMSKVGITSAAEEAGAEVKDLQSEKEVNIEVNDGVALHKVKTYPTIHNCDVLISVPKLKRHGSTKVTISLKNMMGTIPKAEMGRFHRVNLSQCIADLNTVIKPDLTVVDATYAMTRTGPTGGDMVKMDTIIASEDPVAADMVAAQELQKLEEKIELSSRLRFKVDDVKHIKAAADLGVGSHNPEYVEIIEVNL